MPNTEHSYIKYGLEGSIPKGETLLQCSLHLMPPTFFRMFISSLLIVYLLNFAWRSNENMKNWKWSDFEGFQLSEVRKQIKLIRLIRRMKLAHMKKSTTCFLKKSSRRKVRTQAHNCQVANIILTCLLSTGNLGQGEHLECSSK